MPRDRQLGFHEQLIELAKKEGTAMYISRRLKKDGTICWRGILNNALHGDGTVTGITKLTKELSDHEKF